jgi:P4 family phage/plasmid primase-like protien
MTPNLAETRKFFAIISESPEFLETIQVFGESQKPRFDFGKLTYFDSTTYSKRGAITINRKMSAHVPIKGNAELVKDLCHLQSLGYGIYYMVQKPKPEPKDTAGNCRTTENVEAIRTLFLDLDGAPLEPVLSLKTFKPHVIVETSPNKFHCYWKVQNCTLEEHKVLQKSLALKFSGDPAVHDLPRVARIPGFYNLKKEPFLVRVHQVNVSASYDVKACSLALGLTAFIPQVRQSMLSPLESIALIPAGERHTFLMGSARKFAGQGKTLQEVELLLSGLCSRLENGAEFATEKGFSEITRIAQAALGYQIKEQVAQVQEMVVMASSAPAIIEPEKLTTRVEISDAKPADVEPESPPLQQTTYNTKDHVVCAQQLLQTFFQEHKFLWWQERLYNYSKELGYWKLLEVAHLRRILRGLIHASSNKPIPEQFFENVIKVAKDHLFLPYDFQPDNYIGNDERGYFLNLQNGILNLRTLELIPHSDNFFSVGQLPYPYNPNATAHAFETWQLDLFDSYTEPQAAELRQAIVRYMAYCLVPNTNQQKFLLLMGASRGGKGVLCQLFEALLGQDNTASLSLSSLASPHGLTQIPGSKVVIVAETPPQIHHFQLASVVETIKRLSAGDAIVINPKGKTEFKYQSTSKFIMASEFALPFKDAGGGLLKRAVVIPFEKSFAGREDPFLGARLRSELSGILNLALAQLKGLAIEGLIIPEVSKGEVEDYQAGINPIAHFIDTKFKITRDDLDKITNRELFDLYTKCSDAHQYPPIERQSFLRQLAAVMRGRAMTYRSEYDRGYRGIKASDSLVGIEFEACPF